MRKDYCLTDSMLVLLNYGTIVLQGQIANITYLYLSVSTFQKGEGQNIYSCKQPCQGSSPMVPQQISVTQLLYLLSSLKSCCQLPSMLSVWCVHTVGKERVQNSIFNQNLSNTHQIFLMDIIQGVPVPYIDPLPPVYSPVIVTLLLLFYFFALVHLVNIFFNSYFS